ncbi:hypothetical protein [Nostoc sp. DSM 114167]
MNNLKSQRCFYLWLKQAFDRNWDIQNFPFYSRGQGTGDRGQG